MPGHVEQPRPSPTYVQGKANTVLSVAPVHTLAVRWVDEDGRESTCLVHAFGKLKEDGKPGVFILADEQAMISNLKMAGPVVLKGVRQYLAALEGQPTGEEPPVDTGLNVGGEDELPETDPDATGDSAGG